MAIFDATPSVGSQAVTDAVHLAPMMIVAVWALILLLTDAFSNATNRAFQRRVALAGTLLAFVAAWRMFGSADYHTGLEVFSGFLVVDHFTSLMDLAILGTTAAVLAYSGDFARSHRFEYGEQESLTLIAAFGMMFAVHANDMTALFLAIETMSIAVYVMVAARWNSRRSPEAGLKYFILGAFASALLLMGIALVYGATGATSYDLVGEGITDALRKWRSVSEQALLLEGGELNSEMATRTARTIAVPLMSKAALLFPGLLLILAGFMFKVGAVPLHMWTPDVYEGAPSPTTGFMASGVKVAGTAAFLKFFLVHASVPELVSGPYAWTNVVSVIALLSMVVGNLAAVRQTNVKRLLAFSSVAHVGYMLVGVVVAANFYARAGGSAVLSKVDVAAWSQDMGDMAVSAVTYYLLTYVVATVGTFTVVSWMSADRREAVSSHQWAGLGQRSPAMALCMTVCLLSLMGMPPLAGFFGKLYVFGAALEHSSSWVRFLVVAALINSVIGAYYYLRLVVSMYFHEPAGEPVGNLPGVGARAVAAVAAALTLAMGVGAKQSTLATRTAAAGFRHGVAQGRGERVRAVLDSAKPEGDTEVAEEGEAGDAKQGDKSEDKAQAAAFNDQAPGQAPT